MANIFLWILEFSGEFRRKVDLKGTWNFHICKPGLDSGAIAFARTCILHIKNKRVFSNFFIFYSFSTLVVSLFIIALINYSVTLYSAFYFLSFFYIVTFDFSYICYLFIFNFLFPFLLLYSYLWFFIYLLPVYIQLFISFPSFI